jgi:hypothetical protein
LEGERRNQSFSFGEKRNSEEKVSFSRETLTSFVGFKNIIYEERNYTETQEDKSHLLHTSTTTPSSSPPKRKYKSKHTHT